MIIHEEHQLFPMDVQVVSLHFGWLFNRVGVRLKLALVALGCIRRALGEL